MQVAPFDFLVADEVLSEEEVAAARNKVSMWLADGMYAMLPYSSLLLESVPDLDTLPTSRRATSYAAAVPTASARCAKSAQVSSVYVCHTLTHDHTYAVCTPSCRRIVEVCKWCCPWHC